MRTARSSSHLRGSPPGTPLGPDPLPGPGTPRDQTPPGPGTPRGQTHTCKHITLPQTSFAGGNKLKELCDDINALVKTESCGPLRNLFWPIKTTKNVEETTCRYVESSINFLFPLCTETQSWYLAGDPDGVYGCGAGKLSETSAR